MSYGPYGDFCFPVNPWILHGSYLDQHYPPNQSGVVQLLLVESGLALHVRNALEGVLVASFMEEKPPFDFEGTGNQTGHGTEG